MKPKELAKIIGQLALEKKGKEIILLDVTGIADFADFFIIITGDSDVQVKAISDHIEKKLKMHKTELYHKEGYQSLQWVLLDYIDVLVHIFRPTTRALYAIERLWGDAEREVITENMYDSETVY
jgi:ribosome-associated protein